MEILRFEFKKLFINNHGVVFIPLLIIAIIIANFATSNVSNQKLEANKEDYYSLLSSYKLSGIVTDESEKNLKLLINNCDKAENDFDKLFFDFQLGKINRADYQKEAQRLSKITNHRNTINIIKSQFEYSKKDVENRYVMYSNGWDLLFEHSGAIYFLIFVIFIVTLSFSGDTDNGMKKFFITCRNGRSKLILSKLIVTELTTIFSYIAYVFSFVMYTNLKYGLGNGSFPVQSLHLYSDFIDLVSIEKAFIEVCLIRTVALMACVSIVILLYSLINSAIGAITLSFALILIPMIIDNQSIVFLPQNICNYELYDLNFYIALLINILTIIIASYFSIIFWKRRSNSR